MSSSFSWSHYDFSKAEGIKHVRTEEGINELMENALLDEDSRPRALATLEGVLVILRGVNLNPGSDLEDMISIRVWARPDRVVSTGRRRLRSVQALKEQPPESGGEFICRLVAELGDYMGEAVDRLEAKLEEAEDDVKDSRTVARNSPFTALRRQSARIRRYLGPQREALEQLIKAPSDLFDDHQLAGLREEGNRLTLMLEDLDLVRERAMVAQEEFLGIVAHEQNARMLLLSIVAAVFLPLSFVTGLMGMNVAGLPGTENPSAFLILAGLMTLLAAGIMLLFRYRNWL
ncbi:MAG: zinc transporter ZntB [Xanthomonadales bacterium]|nr:zinc transporter ZntB [Xanthomonadales bacterium]